MKTKQLIFLVCSMMSIFSFGQFTDKAGNNVTTCDCMDPIRDLDVLVTLPENYASFDYIQFVLYAGDAPISSRTMRPNEINAPSIKLNVLNSNNKAQKLIKGEEYGRFHGDDFGRASFNSLCQSLSDLDVKVVSFGITQVGVETVYEVDATKTKITSRSYAIFDDGVELSRTESITFKQDAAYAKKINDQGLKTYIASGVSIGGALIAFLVLNWR